MEYWEAYALRLKRNEKELLELAKEVIKANPTIEAYRHKSERRVNSITFFKRDKIKTLIEVSSSIQDTIGRAAYGDAKFEKKIKPIKDAKLIKADFTPEELKKLDERFDDIIEKSETPDHNDEELQG